MFVQGTGLPFSTRISSKFPAAGAEGPSCRSLSWFH